MALFYTLAWGTTFILPSMFKPLDERISNCGVTPKNGRDVTNPCQLKVSFMAATSNFFDY